MAGPDCRMIPKSMLLGAWHSSLLITYSAAHLGASLIAQAVKNPPAIWETRVQFLGREDPLEKG